MNRPEIENFIHTNFAGFTQDYPWEDTPEYTVFRHNDNRKWFALIATVSYASLKLPQPNKNSTNSSGLEPPQPSPSNKIDIINLKSDPDLIEELLRSPGILPAYHMNKTHWITIPLNGQCPDDQLKSLIALSYKLTSKKRPKHAIINNI